MGNKCFGRLETKSTVVTLEILKDHYTHTQKHTVSQPPGPARYRALASIIPGRERYSWNLTF